MTLEGWPSGGSTGGTVRRAGRGSGRRCPRTAPGPSWRSIRTTRAAQRCCTSSRPASVGQQRDAAMPRPSAATGLPAIAQQHRLFCPQEPPGSPGATGSWLRGQRRTGARPLACSAVPEQADLDGATGLIARARRRCHKVKRLGGFAGSGAVTGPVRGLGGVVAGGGGVGHLSANICVDSGPTDDLAISDCVLLGPCYSVPGQKCRSTGHEAQSRDSRDSHSEL